MKRTLLTLLAVFLALSGCAACQSRGGVSGSKSIEISSGVPPDQVDFSADRPPAPEELFSDMSGEFEHASGIGAWRVQLDIAEDGTFTGFFIDQDMGDVGEDFPNGTVYFCDFSGKFAAPVPVNDYTFSTYMTELIQEGTPGEVTYEDGVRCICDQPGGLAGADEILIYCPNAPVAELPEEFLQWVWYLYGEKVYEHDALCRYGLYNVNEQRGFISYSFREG